MTEHNCCDSAAWLLEYAEKHWYMTFKGAMQVRITFCPWCGEQLCSIQLPREGSEADLGDYVVETKKGELRILPREVNQRDGLRYAKVTDILVGTIVTVDKNLRDHSIELLPKFHEMCEWVGVPIRIKMSKFRKSLKRS